MLTSSEHEISVHGLHFYGVLNMARKVFVPVGANPACLPFKG